MKLIIDLPEKVVTAIQNGEDYRYDIHTAIAQGVPYEEKPKGKWVKITKDGVIPIEYICNICGRTVKSYYDEYIITKDFPFCHCGADMRGDAE